jgi:copper chaperone CopZ
MSCGCGLQGCAGMCRDVMWLWGAGMTCGSCVSTVKRLLEGHAAVTAASVNLAMETALVHVKLPAVSRQHHASDQELLRSIGDELAEVRTQASEHMHDVAASHATLQAHA